MSWRYGFIIVVAIGLLTAAPAIAEAQQPDPDQPQQQAEPPVQQQPFGPGTIDLVAMGGLGNLLYLWIEPGIDIGVVEFGDGVTLSVGGGVNLGWCAICGLVSLAPGMDVSGTYVQPSGRTAIHFNQVGEWIDVPELDVYAGALAGPAFYSLTMATEEQPQIETTVASFIVGPIAGARLTLDEMGGLFVAAELRGAVEFGQQAVTIRAGDGDEEVIEETADSVARQGFDINVGIGYRF